MKTIYKYRIDPTGTVDMPADALLLHVGEQHLGHDCYGLFVWAFVETENVMERRKLLVIGTGWPDLGCVDAMPYIGTVQCRNGLVFHIFDEGVWV